MNTASETTGVAQLRAMAGTEIGVSDWQLLDQPRIQLFADATHDHQWIHLDADRASKESPYGGTIAHGYLLLSLVAPTTFELLARPANIGMAVNYGLDKVRFIAPVRSGARVRNRIKLLSVEDKGEGRALLTTENTFEIEGHSKPALVAVALILASA